MNDDFFDKEFLGKHDFDKYKEEGEEWKDQPSIEMCSALSKKWMQIIFTLKGLLDIEVKDNAEDANFYKDTASMYIGDAYIVMAKLRGAAAANMYQVYMENATLIRMYAQGIQSGVLLFLDGGSVDEEQAVMFREQIDEFKELFKTWVASFQKDAFDDEWGLFN